MREEGEREGSELLQETAEGDLETVKKQSGEF